MQSKSSLVLTPEQIEKFWMRVDRRGPNECWPWMKARTTAGYGHFWVNQLLKTVYAHRTAWELTNGPIPEGHIIRHKVCDNPPCCNPAHMLTGTNFDNNMDKVEKGRCNVPKGEIHHWSRFTEDDIIRIRSLYKKRVPGHGLRDIAEEYRCGKETIRSIVLGINWGHVK